MTAKQPNGRAQATTATAAPAPAQTGFFSADSVPRILPFAAYIVFIAIADLLSRLGWTGPELLWLYPVKILVVTALLVVYWRRYTELRLPGLSPGTLLASAAAGLIVFVLWISLDAPWMQIGAPAGFNPAGPAGLNWALVAFRLAGAALVVPVMEELFWRSFLQRWLAKPDFLSCAPAVVGSRALVITAVLFGFEHDLWFAGIVAGLFYGLLYMRTGNIWSPIVAHAVTNGTLGLWVLVTGSWAYW
jgi:CAAX prenyl protease-like protein